MGNHLENEQTSDVVATTTLARAPRPLGVDIDDIRQLWAAPGPYLSALIDLVERADERATRFQPMLADLAARGATDAALAVLGREVERKPAEQHASLAVLAAADGTSVCAASPDPLVRERFEVGPLPRTAAVIDWAQRSPTHLTVVVEPASTTVLVFERDGSVLHHEIAAEPADAAAHVINIARSSDASIAVVTGPPVLAAGLRAVAAPALPEQTELVVTAADGIDELAVSTVRAVADDVARETVSALRGLRLARRADLAAEGVVEVVESLREGRVEELVLHDDPEDPRMLWFAARPEEVAIDLQHVGGADARRFVQAPLVEVLIRSCVLQGGTVRVVPAIDETRLPDGVGAALIRQA